MSGNAEYGEEFEEFAADILGDDDTLTTDEAADGAMLDVVETDNTDVIESEMPDSDQVSDDENLKDEKTKTDTDKEDVKVDSGKDENADIKKDDTATTAVKPPEMVPYERFSKVRQGGRVAEDYLKTANSENQKLKQEIDALKNQLQHTERHAKAEGLELPEYSNEITDELLDRVEEGDPAAVRAALEIERRARESGGQAAPVEQQNTDSWVNHIKDDAVLDTIDDWEADMSEAGDKRMAIAEQVEKSLWSNPENRSLPADDFGKLLIEQTNAQFIADAGEIVDKQIEEKTTEEKLPDNLGGGGAANAVLEGDDALMNLEGEELIAAIDKQIHGRS